MERRAFRLRCSDVFIQSKANAALYTYTPYQPNAAALNNMYSTGDGFAALTAIVISGGPGLVGLGCYLWRCSAAGVRRLVKCT